MKAKIVINSLFDSVLFEYKKEDNAIKDTVQEAVNEGANLCGANLRGANLRGANLRGADLRSVNLRDANLRGADLWDANLCSADLWEANLRGADLCNANNVPYIPINLPEGEFIAWKKLPNDIIVKLRILEDSKRSRATGDKCRCDKALVLEMQNQDGTKANITEYTSTQYAKCT